MSAYLSQCTYNNSMRTLLFIITDKKIGWLPHHIVNLMSLQILTSLFHRVLQRLASTHTTAVQDFDDVSCIVLEGVLDIDR